MQVMFNHEEILEAITAYVTNQGITCGDRELDIDMVAGRGEKGFSATVTICKEEVTKTVNTKVSDIDVTENEDDSDSVFADAESLNDNPEETDDSDTSTLFEE